MTGLYEVEIEPEVRSWLANLSDRDTQHSRAHEIFDREVT
jgi:hypothetical protein